MLLCNRERKMEKDENSSGRSKKQPDNTTVQGGNTGGTGDSQGCWRLGQAEKILSSQLPSSLPNGFSTFLPGNGFVTAVDADEQEAAPGSSQVCTPWPEAPWKTPSCSPEPVAGTKHEWPREGTVSRWLLQADSPGLWLPLHDALASPLRVGAEVVGELPAKLLHGPQGVSFLQR